MEFGVGRNALQRPMDGDEAVRSARWMISERRLEPATEHLPFPILNKVLAQIESDDAG